MRIVINSDILYTGRLATLPGHLRQLGEECARTRAIIVLPRTTLLEIERRQTEIMNDSIAEVERSYEILRRAGLKFEERNAAELFGVPDLADLFRRCGAQVEIEEPTLDDFNEAHRRASLHLPPQPPDSKSDEMRDLVIWVTALRLAARHGDVILLSRDEVHTHKRGDDEAAEVGMRRVKSVDDMLEIMGVETPAGKLAFSLLDPIWDDLRTAGLPLLPALSLLKVDNGVFTTGQAGIEKAEFDFAARAEKNSRLDAHIDITSKGDRITAVTLSEIAIDAERWEEGSLKISPNKPLPGHLSRVDERLDALRDVIGG